ncbi:GH3 auxin-responsive promoter family protein [Tenacibaculum maritimum]|uniref:GH3 auxin-responsive promoter family protein n=1 Tax=Tenacibaculum maritimum TaxID=107401 RepID=UPI0012E603F0|nr:GH3 auxin-responsive promoter family protein [Tenacibaculum maritimum]MCD9562845.1 GH3 auxin-responsive promoter family protein [Tenacibaculum maritimum]MCD9564546.1 GH3 auxin-responsive promoter family protein [Tenacibaculum maritimum]MCD9578275.1 GH3 auxin-responsive promoter family protein [Tenacibaculum maritimum]MCD9582352.1 GH3 auxin-responsive promoter family protein [Tenacibaculum maritimum]MCD9585759.1 GH3 auxin-responsive promoter family protein [Tenacibaculum maritimum]
MSIKSKLAIPFARQVKKQVYKWAYSPHKTQEKVFQYLISKAKKTAFGKDHNFSKIKTYEDFKKYVPIHDYEGLRSYVDRVVQGEKDVLWKGKPLYFAKTSGTTSGAKYIPISKESMPTHIKSARNALLFYIAETNNASFVNGKMIFLQGSPILEDKNGVKLGRLSGIAAHYVPNYLLKNRLPSWKTNCIEDWDTKVNAIVEETIHENMSVISGIPSWVQMYFEKLIERTGKTVSELFPNFNFFIYGGVNFEPYKNKFETLIGKKIDYIELYPASEGFIAYQDSQKEKGMLLQLNSGIFYEFIPATEFFEENPTRISLKEVVLGVNYVIILNTSAGLWGYNIGDTVEFTTLNPYRIKVTGRIKHFISAFGEHVIGKEVEKALNDAIKGTEITVSEFTVAPQVNPEKGLPYHEWFIEFENDPENLEELAVKIDMSMQEQNVYYFDLIEGKVLRSLIIRKVKKGGFHEYMKSIGKFGGQNKIPQLSDNRKIAEVLQNFLLV